MPKFKTMKFENVEFSPRAGGVGREMSAENIKFCERINGIEDGKSLVIELGEDDSKGTWLGKIKQYRDKDLIPPNTRTRMTADGNICIFFGTVVPSKREEEEDEE